MVGVISYTVQQVAELVGVSARTVRYYEAEGLLIPAERTAGQHRRFGVGDVLDLVRIRRMASLGLTLDQIKTILDSPGSDAAEEVAVQLRRSLDAELATLLTRQRTLEILTTRGVPLDALPEFADQLAEFREVLTTPYQKELPRAAVELMATIAPRDQQARIQRLVSNTNKGEQLEMEYLMAQLTEETPHSEVEAVGQRWGDVLIQLYHSDDDYRQYVDCASVEDNAVRAAVQDLVEQSYNEAQLQARAIAQEMLAEHRRQLAEAADQSAP